MFRKVLIANRGEIAIRACRAAYELGARTVAVFPREDRNSLHRLKADESYEIGEPGHPVRAYLSVDELINAAMRTGSDALYPGYGFLSESADLALACAAAGITFIGPGTDLLSLTGNKAHAVAAAEAAGLPVLPSTRPSADLEEILATADEIGFPLFVKAVAGGGGRGMRQVDDPANLRELTEAAMREGESAFGDSTVFLTPAVIRPRHIEVQVLGDGEGNVVHLYERDCSVQRRHQKVVELAPAPNLDPAIRDRLCADAVAFARHIGYVNAGTVEFLVDDSGRHHFLEMNPRIQVEHTVTEETTDVDLVQAQIRIAAGETLADLGLAQDRIRQRGAALQCRITTEDPANGFRPDTGVISLYRSPGGAGIRLDGGTTHTGTAIGAHFDSLLVKLTCRGHDFAAAVRRAQRAVAEFRIRGVATNIAFLQAVLADPDFQAGRLSTAFIADRPHLMTARPSADRGTKLLTYLADMTVNRPHGPRPVAAEPAGKLPPLDLRAVPPAGSRQRLRELGPAGFARALRDDPAIGVTETTFRDAHQSLLATRLRTRDLLDVAPYVARLTPQLLSVECWGGATYDVALRFLGEDPWERLAALREAIPNLCLQMLLRGRNTVGYTPYPTAVTSAFVAEAAAVGLDIFRIFDSLNDIEQMRPAIDAVLDTGTAVAEVAMCYTADLADPAEKLYTLDYYLRLAEQIAASGAHILGIKDMAGLLRPPAASRLVSALRREFDLPIHLHTHDTPGGQLATYVAAIAAGVDAVDGASASLAGTTSQPALSAIVAATDHTDHATGLSLRAVCDLEPYWEAVRHVYAPFESGVPGPTGRVYRHEIPGGQLSNLRQQAIALGLGDRFEQIEATYEAADKILGRLVKVTPSSKVVGDLALHLVGAHVPAAEFEADPGRFDVPDSVIGFLRGELGDPPGGWPEPFRTKALAGRGGRGGQSPGTGGQSPGTGGRSADGADRTADLAEADREALATRSDGGQERRATLNRLLFPGPFKEFTAHREAYGNTSILSSGAFFYGLRPGQEEQVDLEPGVRLLFGLEAIGEPDARGMRTVMATLNGQLRPIQVRDRSIAVDVPTAVRADRSNPDHIAAPFAGVVTLTVAQGDKVEAGQTVATIEAMKMEAAITTPRAAVVKRVAIGGVQQVEGGDLIIELG